MHHLYLPKMTAEVPRRLPDDTSEHHMRWSSVNIDVIERLAVHWRPIWRTNHCHFCHEYEKRGALLTTRCLAHHTVMECHASISR